MISTRRHLNLRTRASLLVLAFGVVLGTSDAAHASLSLGLDSTNYLGKGSQWRQDNYSDVDAQFQSGFQGPTMEAKSHGHLMFSLNQSSYQFVDIPEAYFGTSSDLSSVQVSLGRKLQHWNHLDDEWGLGIWQPRFRWDYIKPESVGLTGTFVSLNRPGIHLVGFVSPLFVPDQSAPLDVASGQVISKSPWAASPPATVPLFGQSTPITYSAQIPSIANIVTQTSLSMMARFGADENERGNWSSVGYAYKPMNQLLTSYDAYFMLDSNNVAATIYPHVEYHQLASFEVGHTSRKVSAWLSVLADRPSLTPQAPTLTSQELSQSIAFGPSLAYDLRGDRLTSPEQATTMNFSFIRQYGGDAPDSGVLADGKSNFDTRYPWKLTAKTGIKSPITERLSIDSNFLYDFQNPGDILSTSMVYRPRMIKRSSFFAGVDLLTSFSDVPKDANAPDFISHYRANDRIYGGFSYAF